MKYIDYDKIAEEAARKYPIGTKYIPLHPSGKVDTSKIRKSSKLPHWVEKKEIDDEPGRINGLEVGYGYVYLNGIWADVVDSNGNIIVNSNLNEPIYEIY